MLRILCLCNADGVNSLVENDKQILVDMQEDKNMALFEVCPVS
jgi:hypothetical protein